MLTKKIFYAILSVAISVLLLSTFILGGFLHQYLLENQRNQLKADLQVLAVTTEVEGLGFLEAFPDFDYRITWIDSSGKVLFDSKKDASSMENHLERKEVQQALRDGSGHSLRYSQTLTESTLYEARRLRDGSVLRVSVVYDSPLRVLIQAIQPILISVFLLMIVSALLAYKLSGNIVEPLNKIDLENPMENTVYSELTPLLQRIKVQRFEQKLLERQRQEFSANVSHELKTPLQSIMGSAELIENRIVKPEDLQIFAGRIRKEASRLLDLINDIIRISQLDEGFPLDMEAFALEDVTREVFLSLEGVAKAKNVDLQLIGSGTMTGVRRLVYEIIYNLCDNGIKYNVENGYVCVSITREYNGLNLTIKDSGIGIAPEHHDRIFERFYRVDKSHSRQSGGTGLGLSIVKHAVQYHHGITFLKSDVGQGTEISIVFPL